MDHQLGLVTGFALDYGVAYGSTSLKMVVWNLTGVHLAAIFLSIFCRKSL